jgi:hypothetical protein
VHVVFCKNQDCTTPDNYQYLSIKDSNFSSNDAGPFVDELNSNNLASASQLYINGGLKILIDNTEFSANSQYFGYFPSQDPKGAVKSGGFPESYFYHSHAPLINYFVSETS